MAVPLRAEFEAVAAVFPLDDCSGPVAALDGSRAAVPSVDDRCGPVAASVDWVEDG